MGSGCEKVLIKTSFSRLRALGKNHEVIEKTLEEILGL